MTRLRDENEIGLAMDDRHRINSTVPSACRTDVICMSLSGVSHTT